MSEDVKVELEEIGEAHEEKIFQKAKEDEIKADTEATNQQTTTNPNEKSHTKHDDKSENINITGKLASVVKLAWNEIAVKRGIEAVTDDEEMMLQTAYAPLENKYQLPVSPELNAVLITGIVLIPKIIKARQTKDLNRQDKPQSYHDKMPSDNHDELQGMMTGHRVDFGTHSIMKLE